jgi:bZIP transcription factor
MSLKRKQILDDIGRTTPIFHKIAEGYTEDEGDNVFDEAFRASTAKVEREIQKNIKHGLTMVEMTGTKTFDFSQFLNDDMPPSGPYRSLSQFFNISTPDIASPSNSFDATTPILLSSNTSSDVGSSSQIATLHLYTGNETGTKGSQNILGDHYQHTQSDLSERPRLLCHESEFPPFLPFAVNQQTRPQAPANAQLSPPFSPENLVSATELLRVALILDDPGGQTPTPRRGRKRKNGLNAGRIERPPAKKVRRTRKVKSQTKEDEAAKREKFRGKNRQAAQTCRARKKTRVIDLLERAEFLVTNNAQRPYEIELTKLELEGLKAMAVEHCRVCPNPSPELRTWFVEEVVGVQQDKAVTSIHHAHGPLTHPPQDADCTGQGTAAMLPQKDPGALRRASDGFDAALASKGELNELDEYRCSSCGA